MLKMPTKAASNKNGHKKGHYKNQDKNRWRHVIAWTIPLFLAAVGLTLAAQTIRGVWLAIFAWIVFSVYLTVLLEWHIWKQEQKQQRVRLRVACGMICLTLVGLGFVWQPRVKDSRAPDPMEERSWLTALDFVLPEEPDVNKKIAVKYSVAITGKAPAVDVTLQSQAYIWHQEPARFEPGPVDPKLGPVSRGILFPGPNLGPSVNFTAPYAFQPESIAAYRNKKALIYVQVLLNYTTGGHPHWARVCAYHAFGEPLDHFTHCEHYNETDENK